PDTLYLLMSISKSITSAMAGVLTNRHQLDTTAIITNIVPDLHNTSFEETTVQHLLDMQTNTHFDENYNDPQADVHTYERVYLWRPDTGQPRPTGAPGYFATLRNDKPHGKPFRYRSILTDVLA